MLDPVEIAKPDLANSLETAFLGSSQKKIKLEPREKVLQVNELVFKECTK